MRNFCLRKNLRFGMEVLRNGNKRYIMEQQGKDVFEYDIFNCPKELKGQLKIGDFTC